MTGGPENDELERLVAAGRRATLSPEALARIKAAALATPPGPPGPGSPPGGLPGLRLLAGGAGGLAVAALILASAQRPSGTPAPAASGPAASGPAALAASLDAPNPPAASSGSPALPAASSELAASAPRPARSSPARLAAAAPDDPREGLLLMQARRALPADPEKALRLTAQHAREFPASQLSFERQQIEREARKLAGR